MSEAAIDPRDPQLRIERILDSGTFKALSEKDKSGMLAAHGTVSGVAVTVFACDATIQGGAMGNDGAKVICGAYEYARKNNTPIVGIWHSGGARLREGVLSLDAFNKMMLFCKISSNCNCLGTNDIYININLSFYFI